MSFHYSINISQLVKILVESVNSILYRKLPLLYHSKINKKEYIKMYSNCHINVTYHNIAIYCYKYPDENYDMFHSRFNELLKYDK
jgi:hypothetical protein